MGDFLHLERRATRERATCLGCGAVVDVLQLGAGLAVVDPAGSPGSGRLHVCPEPARIEWYRSERIRAAARNRRKLS